MAVKYYFTAAVSGSVNWSTVGNWYLGPGGTGGAAGSVPALGVDDVVINAASMGAGVTLVATVNSNCNSLNMTGFIGTLSITNPIAIQTNVQPPGDNVLIFPVGGTVSGTSNINFSGTYNATTLKITSNGKVFPATCSFTSTGTPFTSYATQDTLTCISNLTITSANINVGDMTKDFICGTLNSANTNTRALWCNNMTLTGSGALTSIATFAGFDLRVNNFRINANISVARTFSIPTGLTNHCNIYYGGVGTGVMNMSLGTGSCPNVFIDNVGGQLNFSSSSKVSSLEFLLGNSCTWNNTGAFTLSIDDANNASSSNVGLYMNASTPTPLIVPLINFPGLSVTAQALLDTNGIFLGTSNINLNGNVNVTVASPFAFGGFFNMTNGQLNLFYNFTTGAFTVASGLPVNITNNNTVITTNGAFALNGNLIIQPAVTGTVFNVNNTITIGSTSSGTFPNNSIMNLNSFGNVFTFTVGSTFAFASTSTIKYTDTSVNFVTFAGGNSNYGTLSFERGASTGNINITGSNSFGTFQDNGTAAHSIIFTAGTNQTISRFIVSGNPGNLITLDSSTAGTFALTSAFTNFIPRTQSNDYLNIQHSIANGSSAVWFAGPHSVDNQAVASAGSGWRFTTPTSADMGLLGVG